MKIYIETIPHKNHRYETTGDWSPGELIGDYNGIVRSCFDPVHGDALIVRVSDLGNWKYELCVGIHETVEAALCKEAGITEAAVTAFDKEFEEARLKKFPTPDGFKFKFRDAFYRVEMEPGDSRFAPYWAQHQTATIVERKLADAIGVDWVEYERACADLYADPE